MSSVDARRDILTRMERPGSARQLAILRILIGFQIFYSSSSELLNLLQVVEGTPYTKTIFPHFVDNWIASVSVPYLQWIVQGLSVMLMLGLFTRFILPPLFVAFLALFSFWYGKFDAPVPWLYIWFPLLVLCISRSADALSLDKLLSMEPHGDPHSRNNTYRWPVELMAGWFAYIYFAAGLAKVFPLYRGIAWLDGGTSQKIVYDRYLDSALHFYLGTPLFDYSTNNWFFVVGSLAALVTELACVAIYFTNRFHGVLFLAVMGMHVFLHVAGVPGFIQPALILSVSLASPKWFGMRDGEGPKEVNLDDSRALMSESVGGKEMTVL